MRHINNIVLHCTATSQITKVESIINYWKVNLNWRKPGYHFLIEPNGTIHNLLPIEDIANGVYGHNEESIHISYIGGIDEKGMSADNRTPMQILSMLKTIIEMKQKFPVAKILGHRDFPGVKKDCPSFDVTEWLYHVGFRSI